MRVARSSAVAATNGSNDVVDFTSVTSNLELVCRRSVEIRGTVSTLVDLSSEQVKLFEQTMSSLKLKIGDEESKLNERYRRLANEVQEREDKVAQDRRDLQSEIVRMEELHAENKDQIRINVGGTDFTTLRSTLTRFPDTLFATQFSKKFADPDFLDMNPKVFDIFLTFFRTGVFKEPNDEALRQELIQVAKYYAVDAITVQMRPRLKEESLVLEDKSMKDFEDDLRERYISNREEILAHPYLHLIEVYKDANTVISFMREGPEARPYPRLFTHRRPFCPLGAMPIVNSLDDFEENICFVTGNLLANLDWDNVLLAGGAVLSALKPLPESYAELTRGSEKYIDKMTSWFRREVRRNTDTRAVLKEGYNGFGGGDIDLFIWGLGKEEATQKLREIIEQICKAAGNNCNPYFHQATSAVGYGNDEVLAIRTEHAVTLVTSSIHPHIQVILRIYGSPAEVLTGFDIDSCCFGYNGKKVFCLPRARRSVQYAMNLVDPSRQSRSYEVRLAKYAKRGFSIGVPGFERKLVSQEVYTRPMKDLNGLAKILRLEMLDVLKRHSSVMNASGLRLSHDLQRILRTASYRGNEDPETDRSKFKRGFFSQNHRLLRSMPIRTNLQERLHEVIDLQGATSDYSSLFIPPYVSASSLKYLCVSKFWLMTSQLNGMLELAGRSDHSELPAKIECSFVWESASDGLFPKIFDMEDTDGHSFSVLDEVVRYPHFLSDAGLFPQLLLLRSAHVRFSDATHQVFTGEWQKIDITSYKHRDAPVLTNNELSKALITASKFTMVEWNAFGITDLSVRSIVKSGDNHFTPNPFIPKVTVEELRTLCKEVGFSFSIPQKIEWMTQNPGTQLTGSFFPMQYDWYQMAFAEI
mmetsp:Transcript_70339/g.103055  ORF Transcript_70339/g.103055 Transcript_70339/m.103055 type:complete len:868 (+) Transcript_70339:331-2934(+)